MNKEYAKTAALCYVLCRWWPWTKVGHSQVGTCKKKSETCV